MIQEIEKAYDRILPYINKTPVMTSRTVNNLTNAEVFFKCENFQRVGAFKARGAFNALLTLTEDEKRRGVITHSSGNHAQALALAANVLGIKATIVMPRNAPEVKKNATRGYGAEIIECGDSPEDRVATTQKLIEKKNYTLIHPYNDLRIIYGAGTACLELMNEINGIDLILGPVGGGGLISGTSIVAKGLSDAKVIAIEPENANDAYKSFISGKIQPSLNPNTIADGLKTSLLDLTFKIILKNVDEIITVSEKQIINAMRFIWERMKLVVEPSGAVSFAGLLKISEKNLLDVNRKKIGIIISGGNIDLTKFFQTLEGNLST